MAIYTFESAWNLCCHLYIFIILRKYSIGHLPLVYWRALATVIVVSQFKFVPSQREIYREGGWHWISKILLMSIIPNVIVLAQWSPHWLEESVIQYIKSCLTNPAMILWKQCAAQRKKYDLNVKSKTWKKYLEWGSSPSDTLVLFPCPKTFCHWYFLHSGICNVCPRCLWRAFQENKSR